MKSRLGEINIESARTRQLWNTGRGPRVSGEGGAQDPCPLPRVVPVHARGSETSQGVNDEICAARQAPGAETGLGSARLSWEALREGSWAHRDCRTPAWGGGS